MNTNWPPDPRRSPPPPGAAVAKPRRRRGRIRRLIAALPRLVMVLVLVVIAGIIGGGAWVDTSLHRSPALASYPDRPGPGRGTTWLLVGSDSREELTHEQRAELATGGDLGTGRTDTILLVHTPGIGADVATTMVSLPRDSYVPVPGYGWDKLNTAYALGGPPLLTAAVERATGVRLDHYVEVGFGGFAGLVDALGGVRVCPTDPVDDPLAGIDLPAGCQLLTGPDALGFVRSRATPRADLDRMANQRLFMSALLQRVTEPATWLAFWRWYVVPRALVDGLIVDDGDRVWDLARLAWALRGPLAALTVPIGELGDSDSGSVVIWDYDEAAELFAALAGDSPVSPSLVDAAQP